VVLSSHPVQQAHSLLHLLEVVGQQVGVSATHFKRGVTESLLQVKDASTVPEVVNCERVTQSVDAS